MTVTLKMMKKPAGAESSSRTKSNFKATAKTTLSKVMVGLKHLTGTT